MAVLKPLIAAAETVVIGRRAAKPYIDKLLSIRSANLIGLWDFQESSGALITNKATKTTVTAVECLLNRGFETLGGGGVDLYTSWFAVPGNGAIADETTLVHAGGSAHAAKLTAGASANTYLYKDFLVKPGQTVTISVWTRGDGTNSGQYMLQNAFTGGIVKSQGSWGVVGTAYTQASFTYTPPTGVCSLRLRMYCPAANGGVCYFDDVSVTAITDCTASYPTQSVTYQQPGPGLKGIDYSAKFDGAASAAALGSGGFNALHNPDVGSAIGWMKVKDATVWVDASDHRYAWHPKSDDPSGTYYQVFGKYKDVANSVFWRWRNGPSGDSNEQHYTFTSPPLDWFCMGMTWDITASRLKYYLFVPGMLAWTKAFDFAGLNMTTMAGQTWLNGNSVLAAGGGNSQLWRGWLGPIPQWAGVALSETEMQAAMTGKG